jgi:hypothetical protein
MPSCFWSFHIGVVSSGGADGVARGKPLSESDGSNPTDVASLLPEVVVRPHVGSDPRGSIVREILVGRSARSMGVVGALATVLSRWETVVLGSFAIRHAIEVLT